MPGEHAFYVDVQVIPEHREAFDELMVAHSRRTLTQEEGCLEFEVYVHRQDPNRYALYEVYADDAALKEHQYSNRLWKFRQATDHMISERTIYTLGGREDVSNFPGSET